MSRREYASAVKRIAVGLRHIGLQDEDCVALISRNDMYYYILADGAIAAGGCFAGLDKNAPSEQLAASIQAVDARWLFAEPGYLMQRTQDAAEALGIPRDNIVEFDDPHAAASPQDHNDHRSFSSLLRCDESAWKPYQGGRKPDDRPCHRILTGGSTGPPKAVEISHTAAKLRVPMSVKLSSGGSGVSRPSDRKVLHVGDMHHISGIAMSTSTAMGLQMAYVSKTQPDASAIIDMIERYHITAMTIGLRLV